MAKTLGNSLDAVDGGRTLRPLPLFPLLPVLPVAVAVPPAPPRSCGTQPLKTRPVGVPTRWVRFWASCWSTWLYREVRNAE